MMYAPLTTRRAPPPIVRSQTYSLLAGATGELDDAALVRRKSRTVVARPEMQPDAGPAAQVHDRGRQRVRARGGPRIVAPHAHRVVVPAALPSRIERLGAGERQQLRGDRSSLGSQGAHAVETQIGTPYGAQCAAAQRVGLRAAR